MHDRTSSSRRVALAKATPLNVRHPLSLRAVDSRVEPSLDGCPAVSNVSTDSVACWALTAVPPPVQGVNGHAEHLRQAGDRQQSIKLVGHCSLSSGSG